MKARIYYEKRSDTLCGFPYSIYFPENGRIRGQFVDCRPIENNDNELFVGCWGEIKRDNTPSVLGRRAEKTAPKCIKTYARTLASELGYEVAF